MGASNKIFDIPFPLVLFDGVCNLCTGSVQFILKRDPNKLFQFAALQSVTGNKISKAAGLPTEDFRTFILIEQGRPYFKSTAFLRVTRHLKGGWPLLSFFLIVPRFIRDGVYDLIARNRFRWFGKRETCMIHTPELHERFLN